jgi:YebC/PmpR family DNA-binding regulatory protein
MSGHSHWSTIKHKKEASDKKKGALFSQAARLISLAARQGGADPEMNFELRSAIDKARAVNMPNKNIERAVERGAGTGSEQEEWYRVNYEVFGPGQVALIIEAITNNKNRTLDEIKGVLNRHEAKLAEPGSVRWLFKYVGKLTIVGELPNKDDLELKAIEAGATDLEWFENNLYVYFDPEKMESGRKMLQEKGVNVTDQSLEWIASEEVLVEAQNQAKIDKLLEALSDHDDVQEVYSNANL